MEEFHGWVHVDSAEQEVDEDEDVGGNTDEDGDEAGHGEDVHSGICVWGGMRLVREV